MISHRVPERLDRHVVAGLAALVSVMALAWNYRYGLVLLPNDAIGHINDARRIFDSRTPGIFQLGTVWLPLPQLLQVPFLFNDFLWRSGIGGSIPSMAAYVAGVAGIFRLVRGEASRTAAWIAAAAYGLNPNLVYMQATPMSESLYLALFVWALVYFDEFRRETRWVPHPSRSLRRVGRDAAGQTTATGIVKEPAISAGPQQATRRLVLCGAMLSAAMLVRYDGWFLAACVFCAVLLTVWRNRLYARPVIAGVAMMAAVIAVTAGAWLAYNRVAYGSTLEFVNGPYSVRGITERTTMPDYPGRGDARTAALYFLHSASLNAGAVWGHLSLLNAAFVASIAVLYFSRGRLAWLLLWAPVPFYVLNIAWNSVIVFLHDWWPFSYYNVRYGLQLLPAIAVFTALGWEMLTELLPRRYTLAAAGLLLMVSYGGVAYDGPVCLGEARTNGGPRRQLDINVAGQLKSLPSSATFMLDTRMRSGIAQQAGIPFRRILQPGNYEAWRQGLADPAAAAGYVIAVEGDEVDEAVRRHPRGLELIATVDTPGQPRAFLYRAMR